MKVSHRSQTLFLLSTYLSILCVWLRIISFWLVFKLTDNFFDVSCVLLTLSNVLFSSVYFLFVAYLFSCFYSFHLWWSSLCAAFKIRYPHSLLHSVMFILNCLPDTFNIKAFSGSFLLMYSFLTMGHVF